MEWKVINKQTGVVEILNQEVLILRIRRCRGTFCNKYTDTIIRKTDYTTIIGLSLIGTAIVLQIINIIIKYN